ncbi:MAG TPA: hypothetical protein DDZ66_08795 [Firmicutes bacterium]|jgi:hypothetical protein|nr:hypothetical protein [Bacillota bacterium]
MLLLGLFLFFVSLLCIRFSVEFRLIVAGLDIKPRMRFGIGRYLLAMPQGLLTKTSQMIRGRNFGTLEGALRGSKTALRLLDNVLQKVDLLHLEILIGTGDPFWTALGVGGTWAIISPLLTGLSADNRLHTHPEIRIHPDYGNANVHVDLHCIFRFRLGQIIINEVKRVMV